MISHWYLSLPAPLALALDWGHAMTPRHEDAVSILRRPRARSQQPASCATRSKRESNSNYKYLVGVESGGVDLGLLGRGGSRDSLCRSCRSKNKVETINNF